MASRDNGLPPKESTLFKSIVKHYETKQYKKGLKAADQVLKKFPDHGETLAMKGLILNCMERKAEAYDLVRLGVKKDIRSHVCWHVYGLLYRSDREYLQAIKCYRSALRHDADNIQILRDLSLLQIQMRDLDGFVQTRRHLLTLKPTNRNNWFTFAVSQHLKGRHDQALGIVNAYEDTLEGSPENDYEHSEMLLYKVGSFMAVPTACMCMCLCAAKTWPQHRAPTPSKPTADIRSLSTQNMLMEEGGQFQEALAQLEANEDAIVDRLFFMEKRAGLLHQLSRFAEAEEIYRKLIKRNPEHHAYHAGLQACLLQANERVEQWLHREVDAGTESKLKDLYAELQHHYPRSAVCRRIPLDFARDPDYFRIAAKTYMLPPLRKGVPSLFADIKPLYAIPAKGQALGAIFSEWLSSIETTGCLKGESTREMPSTRMWLLTLLGQHCDMMGKTAEALEHIDNAIDHTPTLLDLYMLKARILKHGGALAAASDTMDSARKMDLADRYLNTKATRYMLRADQQDEAQKTIGLFTKDGDQQSNLFDMQCMWYELEIAKSYRRTGDYGRALKNFTSVDKHFTDIVEDQFDFHTYCVRKMTLRAYVRMLRMEDTIYGHTFYVKAACELIETYIELVDKPKSNAEDANEAAMDEMSAAERKKAESKRRKAEAKAKAEADAKAAAEAKEASKDSGGAKGKGGKGKEKVVDDDPDGAALAGVADPLSVAAGFLRTLQMHAPSELRTWTLAATLAMRKGRYLLVLRALRKAHQIAPDDPEVHRTTIEFLQAVQAATLHPTVKSVIESQRGAIGAPSGQSLEELNKAFLLRAKGAPAAVLAAAALQLQLVPNQKSAALALVTALDPAVLSLPLAMEAHALLAKQFGDAEAADFFKRRALLRYPLADCFR